MNSQTSYSAEDLRAALARVTTARVHVEHTGGGCATLYLGEYRPDGHALLAIGPGSYHWSRPEASNFDFAQDVVVGPDDSEGGQHDTLARDLPHLLALVTEWLATLDSSLLVCVCPNAGDCRSDGCDPACTACQEDVVDVLPGTPAWDVSEAALDRQRRAGR